MFGEVTFCGTWFGATDGGRGTSGSRVFDVRMENRLVEDDLDIFNEIGAESILVKSYTVIVEDGTLNIDFSAWVRMEELDIPLLMPLRFLVSRNIGTHRKACC
ncbi:malectin domain-containing carbohydrate-binding protein [Winogradskyella maritima]|nr:malectin domain-containing carbohydrate-binding protein [Winogradskyella maritima]